MLSAKTKSRSQGLLFALAKINKGIRTRREQTCLRKKTVRWTVFADVVKERSDAKAHGSAPKKFLAIRQNEKQVARPAFCIGKTKRGIRTRREQTCLRKKTVRWTVLADVVKEQSDAKAHGSAPKKFLAIRHKAHRNFDRITMGFFYAENRLKSRLLPFLSINEPRRRAILQWGFVRFTVVLA